VLKNWKERPQDGMPTNCRTVITEPRAQKNLEQIYGSAELADTAIKGIWAIISHSPQSGTKVIGNVWFIATVAKGIWQSVSIYYTFSDDEVLVIHIEKTL
jgi:hypothetical protein